MPIINAIIAGGGSPVIDPLNVTPSTSAQTITASGGVDGYSPVNVSAVTSSIDANITTGNIKDGVEILGVTGSVIELNGETKTVTPQVYGQTLYPTAPKNGITEITVNPVTHNIDANITAGNIKKDVQILGVTGSYEGQTPTGTKSITSNGVYDVTNFASADVQVPTTAPAHYIEKTVDANGKLQNSTNIINLSGVTDVGDYALYAEYFGVIFPANTSIDLSSLTTISGVNACTNMFTNTRGVTSADLSSLTTISGRDACNAMFSNAYITSVNLSSLTTISGSNACNSMFLSSRITSIDLSSLTTISGNNACGQMFFNCSYITSIKMNSLNIINYQLGTSFSVFAGGCTHLESVEFGGLTASTFASAVNLMQYLFNSNTGNAAPNGCTVHFPSNFDPSDPNHTFDASTLTGYPTFGGDASYIHVAFDLPASE